MTLSFGVAHPEHPRRLSGEGGGGKEQGRSSQRFLGRFWCRPWPCVSLESPSRHTCSTASRRRTARGASLAATAVPARPTGTPPGVGTGWEVMGSIAGESLVRPVLLPGTVSRRGAERGLSAAAFSLLCASVSLSVE